jgi:hypothetical protein
MLLRKAAFAAALCFCTLALAQDKRITRADLPAAVQKALPAYSQGATVKGYSQERENGHTYYEAEMTVNGHSKDVSFDSSGAVVEIEEQVALEALPASVRDGLQSKAGRGKILKVESIIKHDKIVAYEANVQKGVRRSEIQVGPDGKPLDHEE